MREVHTVGLTSDKNFGTLLDMSTTQLTEQVMALPLAERIFLAEALLQSISEGLPESTEGEAISKSIQRDAQLTSGAAVGRTHDEVMASARRAIGCD